MTSADFLLRYGRVSTALFDHIQQDMLALTSAFIYEAEAPPPAWHDVVPPHAQQPQDIPLT